MDFESIEKGDKLEIKKKKYEVIQAWDEDFDELPSGKERWYSIFEMVEVGSGKITSTHALIYYQDGKDIFLVNRINKKKERIKNEEIKIFP